jgi:hypothetical protein
MTKRQPKPKPGPPAKLPPAPPPVDPARVEQVIQWVLAGQRDFDIAEAIREQWPDQDYGALMREIGEQFLRLAHLENPDVLRGWALAATQDVYRQMRSVGDLVGSLRAIKQVLEISGG